jgi:EAL domain-containing protein (putative c-di-GMP-specific phosphodiesterase class I)
MFPSIARLVELASSHANLAGRLSLAPSGAALGHLDGVSFGSDYQPIFDIAAGNATQSLIAEPHAADRFGDEVGFEARARVIPLETGDGAGALQRDAAPELFSLVESDAQLVGLDRLARAVHTINFFGAGRGSLLFLNVHERLLKSVRYDHGRHFSTILLSFGLNPARVVIELPESAVAHKTFLGFLTKSYQSFGFKVAGNLPNAGQVTQLSDMARLDYLKIDTNVALRDSMVRPLVNYAARLKIPLVFKNVDTEAQFTMLQQYDVRFVQGAVFAAV